MSAAEAIRDFLYEIDGSISRVVTGHMSIPTWSFKGANITEADRHHIKNLAIPALREKAETPSLLLHNLGHFSSDPNLKERVENIFMPDLHTFFFGTPGSGKTRLVLEGLCQNWGFYFTSSADSSRLGSTDIQQVIQAQSTGSSLFHSHLPPTGSSNYIKSICHDRAIVSGDLRRVFLARLIILTFFVEKMDLDLLGRDPHTSINEYRKRWLLLQAFPQLGHPKGRDIFIELAVRLSTVSDNWVTLRSGTYLERVRDLIAPGKQGTQEKTHLFCVVDEVQFAVTTLTQCTGSFSSIQEDDDRNIVGEFMRIWEEDSYAKFVDVFIVFVGTGIAEERVESAIKEESIHRKHTDTGTFRNAETHRQYLAEYLPKSLIESDSGKRLLYRLWYWLHGRYGFTAGFVEELIRNGFRQPHRLLNNYVHHFTKFWISDAAEYLENEEQQLELPILSPRLDFTGFTKKPEMLNSIYDVARNSLMGSGTRDITEHEVNFIQYALARCVRSGTQRVSIDEPLSLLAIIQWMNTPRRQTVHQALARDLRMHTADKINGFEKYIALSLSLIFSKERPLNDVFTFHGTVPAWAGMNAELVSVFYDGAGNLDTGKTSLLELITPSATLGVDAKQADETLSWLQHRDRATFCFPHESMRPDILFVLRLPGDGSYIWVAIQSKWCESLGGIPKELVVDAMESVTPSRFFLTKHGRSRSAYSDLREQVLESLRALPNKKIEAGSYSLLRVIASFPAPAMVDPCISEDPDEDGHPIATLNMDLVKEVTRELLPARKLEEIENDWRKSRSSRRTVNTNSEGPHEERVRCDFSDMSPCV